MVESCLHAANILYLGSFLTRDMLWLRLLTCCGLALGATYFSCQAAPMYGPAAWHVAFLVINGVQIVRLVRERRRLTLSAEQEAVARAAFADLSREEMLTLLTRALCTPGKCVPDLRRAARLPLTEDERVVRDVALSGLSRAELVNLLARRLWQSLRRVNPARWRRPAVGGPPPGPTPVTP